MKHLPLPLPMPLLVLPYTARSRRARHGNIELTLESRSRRTPSTFDHLSGIYRYTRESTDTRRLDRYRRAHVRLANSRGSVTLTSHLSLAALVRMKFLSPLHPLPPNHPPKPTPRPQYFSIASPLPFQDSGFRIQDVRVLSPFTMEFTNRIARARYRARSDEARLQ